MPDPKPKGCEFHAYTGDGECPWCYEARVGRPPEGPADEAVVWEIWKDLCPACGYRGPDLIRHNTFGGYSWCSACGAQSTPHLENPTYA